MIFFNPTDEFVDKLAEVIGDRMVIEIGSGNGDLLKALLDRGISAIGIDPFADTTSLGPEIRSSILPFDLDQTMGLVDQWKGKKEIVFLTARPCHSGFPQEYLSMFGNRHEMIYIGYTKNLEIDFERELSFVRFIKFPDHPDCDCVAVLRRGNFNESVQMSNSWDKVDMRIRDLVGSVSQELLNWFKEIDGNQYDLNKMESEALQKHFGKTPNSSSSGGNWKDWKDAIRLSEIFKYRKVKLDVSTYMVGGGHFSCSIKVNDDEMVGPRPGEYYKGELVTGRPWNKSDDPDMPEYARYDNITWDGKGDRKRTSNLEAGLEWLKQSYYEFVEEYKKLGIELVPEIESGLKYEIEELK